MKKIKTLLLIILVCIIFVGCGNDDNEKKKPISNNEDYLKEVNLIDQEIDGLKIGGFNIVYENGISHIVASATNVSDNPINVIRIDMLLFDKNNNELISTSGFVGNTVDSNASIVFKADVTINLLNTKSVKYSVVQE